MYHPNKLDTNTLPKFTKNPTHILWRVKTICRIWTNDLTEMKIQTHHANENRLPHQNTNQFTATIFLVDAFDIAPISLCLSLLLTFNLTLTAPINFDFDCKLLKLNVGMRCQQNILCWQFITNVNSIGDKFKYDCTAAELYRNDTHQTEAKLDFTCHVLRQSMFN